MAKKWIAKAVSKNKGAFRKQAEAAGESTREFADGHKGDAGVTGKRARMALTLMGMNHSKHATSKSPLYTGKKG